MITSSTCSVAERRRTNLGMERVARARLSEDETRIENVTVILEGAERRLAFAPDGTLFATGADRFRFYNSDLSGGPQRLRDRPHHPQELRRQSQPHQYRRVDAEGQPVPRRAARAAGCVRL